MSYLEVKNIKVYFPIHEGIFLRKLKACLKAVDGISFSLERGKILGLVGESGCGKSTLGKSILQLISSMTGEVYLDGQDLTKMSPAVLNRERPRFQMIFQDPYASLNPRMTVYDALAEPILVHGKADRKNIFKSVRVLLEEVGLSINAMNKYPHEFSGGQRQRIAIARALTLEPELIIADEPVSALDVSIQSQILNLLKSLSVKRNLTMIFISHDLSVVRFLTDQTAVMYLGKIVEFGPTENLFSAPLHPYTKALIAAIPVPDPESELLRRTVELCGDIPSPMDYSLGCRFFSRCPVKIEKCHKIEPQLEEKIQIKGKMSSQVACLRVDENLF